jgi:Uma2 family endonuclease
MARATSRPRNTLEDFLALPEGVRAEWIDGKIVMAPAPRTAHQEIVGRLHLAFGNWLSARGGGRVLLSPVDVRLPSGDIVEPDLVLVAERNLGIIHELRIEGAPDLLIEVLSPADPTHDRVRKRDLNSRNGVPEYWIVDPDARTVEVLRLDGGTYATLARLEGGATLRTPALPGLEVSVSEVFPEAG